MSEERVSFDSADFSFLTGNWQAEIWGGIFEEAWTSPVAQSLQGTGRLVKNGQVEFMEFASIEPFEGGFTLWMILGSPSKGGKTPVPFRLENYEPGYALFSNLENDYPNKISYQSINESEMTCTLSGTEQGEPKSDVFQFKRIETK